VHRSSGVPLTMLKAAVGLLASRRGGRAFPALQQLRAYAAEPAPAASGDIGYVAQVIGEWNVLPIPVGRGARDPGPARVGARQGLLPL
jgi:hypothetical protein